jgi:hypothetical protein
MPKANHLGLDDREDDDAPPKKKQKRNKPTLSCSECVDRKTKVSHHQIRHTIARTADSRDAVRPGPTHMPGLHQEKQRVQVL